MKRQVCKRVGRNRPVIIFKSAPRNCRAFNIGCVALRRGQPTICHARDRISPLTTTTNTTFTNFDPRARPWRTVEDVELATLGWVDWHNHRRLHGYLGDVPPTEFEKTFYDTQQGTKALAEIK